MSEDISERPTCNFPCSHPGQEVGHDLREVHIQGSDGDGQLAVAGQTVVYQEVALHAFHGAVGTLEQVHLGQEGRGGRQHVHNLFLALLATYGGYFNGQVFAKIKKNSTTSCKIGNSGNSNMTTATTSTKTTTTTTTKTRQP